MEQIDVLSIDNVSYEIVDGISKAQNQQAQQTLDVVTQTTNTTVQTLQNNANNNFGEAETMQYQVESAQEYNVYTAQQVIQSLRNDYNRLVDALGDAERIRDWLGSLQP